MNDVLKVAAAAIIAAVCAVVVRRQNPEIALLLAGCGAVLILLYCSGALRAAVDLMDRLSELSGLSRTVTEPVLKVTGISVVTRLAAEMCRDAREGALATAVETAGTALALVAVIPLMLSVLELMADML